MSILAASTLLLHLQCTGAISMGMQALPATVEIVLNDLTDSGQKTIDFHLTYGLFMPTTQDDSITVTNDQFFVRQTRATGTGDEFVTASNTANSGLVQAVSPVDYPTFATQAAAGQAKLEFRLPARQITVPLTCKSVAARAPRN